MQDRCCRMSTCKQTVHIFLEKFSAAHEFVGCLKEKTPFRDLRELQKCTRIVVLQLVG